MKEIVQIYHYDPSTCGNSGVLRYVHNMLEYLEREPFEVKLLGVRYYESTIQFSNIIFIPIVHKKNSIIKYPLSLFIKLPFIKISSDAVIHTHHIAYAIPFLFWKRKNPLIITIHWERITGPSDRIIMKKIYRLIGLLAFNKATTVVFVSNNSKTLMVKEYPNLQTKAIVIPVGVDRTKFKPMIKANCRKIFGINNDQKVVLSVGVLEYFKNVGFLIKSFAHILKTLPNALLIIAGEGQAKKSLVELVSNLGISSNVIFLGSVEYGDMPHLYNCADVFSLCSLQEASPTVVKEALSCGIPVVSLKVGDVAEVLTNPLVGKVVGSASDSLFAESIIEFLLHSENDSYLTKQECVKISQQFSFEEIVKKYVKIYNTL